MEETKKRTERKSQGVRSRLRGIQQNHSGEEQDSQPAEAGKPSRVVDMSWAAAYLDDEWENKYSREGGYDTKSAALAREDTMEGPTEHEIAVDLLSQTQEFKAVEETQSFSSGLKIRDAVTDQTIVSMEDAEAVRDAAARVHSEEMENMVKLRDAVTGQTIVSVDEARKVRSAAADSESDEEPDDLLKIRDAVTDRTIHSFDETQTVRSAVSVMGLDEDLDDLEHIRDARRKTPRQPVQYSPVQAQPQKETPEPKLAGASENFAEVREEKSLPQTVALKFPLSKKKSGKKEQDRSLQEDLELEQFIQNDEEPDIDQFIEDDLEPEEQIEDYISRVPSASRKKKRPSQNYDDRDYRQPDRYERDYYEDYVPVKSPLRFIPLVLVIAVCVFGFIAARTICYDIPVNSSDYSKKSYTVTAGLTDAELAQDLENMGLIDNPLVFRLRCIFYDADYKEGTYDLSPCFSTEKIINILSGYQYGE